MDGYVDGFVIPVKKDKLDEYKRVSESSAPIFKEHGALAYWECLGDDLDIEGMRSFRDAADAQEDEVVMFAWVLYPSREARDEANQKIMNDPRMLELCNPDNPLFDCARMAYGGFQPVVKA